MIGNSNINLIDTIREILRIREPNLIRGGLPSKKHASVLIPLFEDEGILKVLFTKRTDKVDNHKGQFSFPGGSKEEDDVSVEQTALRESYEEIGLWGEDVKILGRIDDALTVVSGFIVHPVVGLIPYPYEFVINRKEVKRLITVPLDVFQVQDSENKIYSVVLEGVTYHSLSYEHEGDIIWGATARIMKNFVDIIRHSPKNTLAREEKIGYMER